MENERGTRFVKLGTGGDIYGWINQMMTHFQARGHWNFVSQGVALELPEGTEVTQEMVAAKCANDIKLSLHPDVLLAVRHCESPTEMYQRVVKIFLGSLASQKRKLRTKLNELTFDGNYFFFLSQFDACVTQLRTLNAVASWKDTCLLFLDKLPTSLSMLTYQLRKSSEEAEEDDVAVWNETFSTILDYLIDAKLYNPNKRQYKNGEAKAFQSKVEVKRTFKKKHKKCYICQDPGHLKRDCPHRQKYENQDSKRNAQSWVCKSECEEKMKPMDKFVVDSGANNHVCGNKNLFKNMKKLDKSSSFRIMTANGFISASHVGDVEIVLDNGLNVTLKDVLYWPGAPLLLSVPTLMKRGLSVTFRNDRAEIRKKSELLYTALKTNDDVFVVGFKKTAGIAMVSQLVWHMRLNHAGSKRLENTVGTEALEDGEIHFNKANCVGCMKGKATRKKISKKPKVGKCYEPLELIVADSVGPYQNSVNKKKGALIMSCAGSGYAWVEPFRRKSEIPSLVISILKKLERSFPGRVKKFRSDNAKEFLVDEITNYFDEMGIEFQRSTPHVHEENGRAEKMNQTLVSSAKSLLYNAGFKVSYWPFALKAACFAHNCIVPVRGEHSPWELIHGGPAPLHRLCVFGTPGFAHIASDNRKKLAPNVREVFFMGYSNVNLNYIVMDVETRRIFNCRTFYRDEEKFATLKYGSINNAMGESNSSNPQNFDECDFNGQNDDGLDWSNEEFSSVSELPMQSFVEVSNDSNTPNVVDHATNDDDVVENDEVQVEDFDNDLNETTPETNFCDVSEEFILPTRLRSEKNAEVNLAIKKSCMKMKLLMKAKVSTKGFRSFKDAVAQDVKWKNAYDAELRKLERLGNFKVIKRTSEMKPLPFLEVLTNKLDNVTGEKKLKVRLAARGDLTDSKDLNVFSPTTCADEIRMFVIAMRSLKCKVLQGDVPSAYLNGKLKEPIILYLPDGHELKNKENSHVYWCPSAIYGLPISGRVWFLKFKDTVRKVGLINSFRNPCLFKLVEGKSTLFLQLYVDDFIMGSTDENLLKKVELFLNEEFNVVCTDDLRKFVGIQFKFEKEKLFLHQRDMIEELRGEYRVFKNIQRPMILNQKWTNSTKLEDVKPLQKLVGSINYISGLTRPDISYATNRIARKINDATKEVFRSGKRIIEYLACTSDLGIEVKIWNEKKWNLVLYTDSSFADLTEEKYSSTGGYLMFLNGTPVNWKSKKLKHVCNSTAEAEYMALFIGVREAIGLGRTIEDYFGIKIWPLEVYTDNQASLEVIKGNGSTNLRKHMATKYYSLQEWFENGFFILNYKPSMENVADLFTKQVGSNFINLRDQILKPQGSVEKLNQKKIQKFEVRSSSEEVAEKKMMRRS